MPKYKKSKKISLPNAINIARSHTTFQWILKLIISIVILYIAHRYARKIANLIVDKIKTNHSQQKNLIIRQLSDFLFYVIFILGVLIALINLGVQTTTIITLLGTVMVAIGLAVQGTLSNTFSGLYVALSGNFQIGDVIRVYIPFIPGGPIEGKVVDFNIAYVKLKDANSGKLLFLPNISVASNALINLSRSPTAI
jgi:small conductance mechanosensitive channel